MDDRPLVVHLVHRFDTGGLENGIVNLINHMPEDLCRHTVVALTEVTAFANRVHRRDVHFVALGKGPGHGARLYPRLWKLLRQWRPAVVHTRNLGPLEMQVAAAAAGVPLRVHGEHGRELSDPDGLNPRFQRLRRLYAPFVHRYIALSRDLQEYLVKRVGVGASHIDQIYNGVDTLRFYPAVEGLQTPPGCPFDVSRHWCVGHVGRMQGVKDQLLLVAAFLRALELRPMMAANARLVLVGEGPLRAQAQALLASAGASALAWLPGERADVAQLMRAFSCFVLPSRAEGISNTILEAMSSGLPVVATQVGGNAELVQQDRTGMLVPHSEVEPMAQALVALHSNPAQARTLGLAARAEVERRFSLQAMVAAYERVYGLPAVGALR